MLRSMFYVSFLVTLLNGCAGGAPAVVAGNHDFPPTDCCNDR
ncbi:hypothetical protein AAFO92_05910 [Roseovarius sp. CAU 1744]